MNQPLYKEAARSGFQVVNAADWENERLFKWQEKRISELAMERRISYKRFKELMKEWVGKELVGELNRKEGVRVIKELKNFKKLVCLECMGTGFAIPSGLVCGFCLTGKIMKIEKRNVGKVKVGEF